MEWGFSGSYAVEAVFRGTAYVQVPSRFGPVDKSKNSAEPCSGPGRIVNWEIEKDGILPSA